MSQSTAGWYEDGWGSGMMRWWDGTTWTDHLSDVPSRMPHRRIPSRRHPPMLTPAALATAAAGSPSATSDSEVFEALEKLGSLRDAGVVTPEEFEVNKAEILGRIS